MPEFLQIATFVAFNGIIVLFSVSAVLQNRENHLKRSATAESIRTPGSGQTMSPAGDRSPSRRTHTERTRARVDF